MGIGDRIRALLTFEDASRPLIDQVGKAYTYPTSTVPAIPSRLPTYYANSTVDWRNSAGDLTQQSIIMMCINWKVGAFADAPLRIWKRIRGQGEDQPLDDHPFLDVLRRPNEYFTPGNLWAATILSYDIDANAFWIKIRDRTGQLTEVWYEPHFTIRPVIPRDGSDFITGYELYRNGRWVPIESKDVLHVRAGIDPGNIRYGLPSLASALKEVFTDNEAASYSAMMLRNRGVPGAIISPAPDPVMGGATLTPAVAEVLKSEYQSKVTGDHRGEPIVLSKAVNVTTLGFNPSEMNLDALRAIPESRIAGLLRMPAIVAGLKVGLDHATYSNYDQAIAEAYQTGLVPMYRTLGEHLTYMLWQEYPESMGQGLYASFDVQQIKALQEDQAALSVRVQGEWKNNLITRAEARRTLGRPATADDEVYYSEAVTPAPLQAHVVGGSSGDTPALGDGTDSTDTADSAGKTILLYLPTGKAARRIGKKSTRVYTPDEDNEDLLIAATADALSEFFLGLGIAAVYLDDLMVPAIAALDLWAKQGAALGNAMRLSQARTTARVLGLVARELEIDAALLTGSLPYVQYQSSLSLRVRAMEQAVIGQTTEAIAAAVASGKTGEELRAALKNNVAGATMYPGIAQDAGADGAARYRAEVIAKTETAWTRNQAAVAFYEAGGIKRVRVTDGDGCGWLGHNDARKADGLVVDIDEARAHPLAHPHCVRRFSAVIEEE